MTGPCVFRKVYEFSLIQQLCSVKSDLWTLVKKEDFWLTVKIGGNCCIKLRKLLFESCSLCAQLTDRISE